MELNVEAFDRICRACLTESGNMKSLLTKLDNGHLLLDLLIFTANIDAHGEDGLPKQVCSDCETLIHKAGDFKRRCIQSETVLKNIHQNNCSSYFVENNKKDDVKLNFCVEKLATNSDPDLEKRDLLCLFSNTDITFKKLDASSIDEKHIVKEEIGVEYENNDYDNDFDDRDQLMTVPIEFKQEKTEPKSQKCVCGETYENKTKYKEHIKKFNCNKKKTKKQEAGSTFIPIKNELACQKCNQTFNLVSEWSAHQECHSKTDDAPVWPQCQPKTEETPQFQCSLCLRKFKTKKSLTKHIKRHEKTDNIKYVCPKCKREFKYKSFLESHMISVHLNSTEGYACENCPEKFTTKKSLEVHKDVHKKRKNVCPFCDKSFLMLCTLKDHLRIHTGEKPFLCSVCGKGFSQKTNLGQHMRRHMGVKPFKCDTCSMGFVSKGELDAHLRKHSGAHPFICDECGNGFTTSSALVKHRRIHTGERPYACDLCPMKFAATGTLKNHRRTHTGERPYQCSHCDKSFVQRSDLISHIRCHTGERPFVCPQCGQAFRKAAAMKAHVKMHARENQSMALQSGLMLNGMQCDSMNT